MSKKDENILAWVIATITFAGAGFAAGAYRLVWGLFAFVTILWWWLCWYLAQDNPKDSDMYVLFAVIPPIFVAIVLGIVQKIVIAIFGSVNESDKSYKQ